MKKLREATQEPQYKRLLDVRAKAGVAKLGLMSNFTWHDDPKRLVFVLSRYKFVAKMFSGYDRVLEIGCGDAFASRIVRQEVERLTVTDFDPLFIADANSRMDPRWKFEARVHDPRKGPVPGKFDGAYTLDVLEHVPRKDERAFVRSIVSSLTPKGALIVGMPSLESQAYASPGSREGHVNCKSAPELRALMSDYFDHVFIFSMNDEVVHTGFHRMANYLFALCCGPRRTRS